MEFVSKLRDLWQHAGWADEQVLAAVEAAGAAAADEVVREVAHLVAAQEVWLARLQGRAAVAAVWPTASLRETRALFVATRAGFAEYLADVEPAGLARTLTYMTSDGRSFTSAVGDILLHLLLHGQYHRGRVNLLLRQPGRAPAPTDYIAFARGGAAATSPAPVPDRVAPALRRALTHAESYLAGLDTRPVGATATVAELRARLGGMLPDSGTDAVQVIEDLVAATAGGLLGSAGGRFYAWVIGGALPAALAADWLTSAWDQNAALCACGPAAAVVEEVAGDWLLELLDLPREASFALTTGCQMAHVTALAAARHAVLRAVGWDVNEAGLCGAPPVRVLVSEQRHQTVDGAVRFLGLGTRSIVAVATDEQGRMSPAALVDALARGDGPTIVVLDAADLNIAAFDDFATLIPLAHARGAWVHVDGAFGLIARASAAKRSYLAGVEAADSWATDAHKWLNVPYDCGLAFVRDREAHRAAMSASASYIAAAAEARDQIDWNPEWSRRARGFALYAALRELGREGVVEVVDRSCACAAAIVDGIGALPGVEVLWRPHLNQGLVRFRDGRPGATDADHDARTDAVIAAVNRGGEAFFSGSTWRGRRAMRVSVVNWRTDQAEAARAVAAVARALRGD